MIAITSKHTAQSPADAVAYLVRHGYIKVRGHWPRLCTGRSSSMSNMKCEQCGRYRLPDPAAFRCGDKVTFKRVIQRARTTQLKAVDGVIVEAGVATVTIRVRGGDRVQVNRTGITMQGAPGPLTYELFGVCHCEGGQS